jgi:hypothetical protein
MALDTRIIKGGELCWLHFNTTEGQSQCGDYGYQKCYAPNRSEKIEDGETYVKVLVTDVWWKYGRVCFNITTVNKDGSGSYDTQVFDADRLTLIN